MGDVVLALVLAVYAVVAVAVGWSLRGMWDERQDDE